MVIKYKVVNVDIQTSISLLQKFVKKLKEDVDHYRKSVDVFYKNYLLTLISDNNNTKYLRPYSEFNKVDSMYKKFKRFLNDFLTAILKDYSDALEIGSSIRSLKNEFDDIVKKYSYLYKNSPKKGIEVSEEFSSMENLKKLHYAITKLDKIKQSYNERVIAYNEYILQFYGIERNFENRILTFTTSYNKTHSLVLDYYTEYFMSLLQNDNIGNKKREILKGYLKNLTVKMEGFSKSSLRGVKKINNIDFGKTDSGNNSERYLNNDQTKSSKQNLFATDISQTEKPENSSSVSQFNNSGTSMPQTKSLPQPISSSIPKDIPQTGQRPKVVFKAPFNRSSGTSMPQTKSLSQPISSSIPKDIPQTELPPKPIFENRFRRSSELSELSKTKNNDPCPLKRDPLLPLKQCCLIPNANSNPFYKKNNYSFDISNTCGFDSITQILLASITDDFCYASKMERSSSDVIKFIFKLQTADKWEAGKLRNDYLAEKFMETREFDSNNYHHRLNFYRTLTPIWDVYFNSLPSGYYCYECHSIRQPRSALTIVYEDIGEVGQVAKRRKIDMSIPDKVNKLLAEPERFKCPECDKCVSNFELNNQVFIDITLMAESGAKLFSDLELFPISLTLLGTNFRLAGVIERVPGHFIANVRRIDGSWEVHNDLAKEIFKLTNLKKKICPEAAIYIKE